MAEVEEEERPQTQFVGGGISKRAHTPKTGLFDISILYQFDGRFVLDSAHFFSWLRSQCKNNARL